jgi:hypothetical protein
VAGCHGSVSSSQDLELFVNFLFFDVWQLKRVGFVGGSLNKLQEIIMIVS